MRLDHISYATSHDQLADTVQRIGSRLGTTFVDGGIHPRFGTRNFTSPLIGGQYIEVVCPLDHPATEQTPWGKAVSQRVTEGGGWLTWVFSSDDISPIEKAFGRNAVAGHRTRPDGTDLKWKQIGVAEITNSPELPFFIEWESIDQPGKDGEPVSKIESISILEQNTLSNSLFYDEISAALRLSQIEILYPEHETDERGIVSVSFISPNGIVTLD